MTTKDDLQRERDRLLADIREAKTHNRRAVIQERLNEVDEQIDKINAEGARR